MISMHCRRHLPALGLWTLLWGLFFAAFLAGRQELSAGDLSGQFHAYALFQAQELRAGRVPLWSPGSYGGIPFAADPQAAVFYPPRWLTILAAPAEGLPFALLQLEILAHVWLAGAFTYGLLHALTGRRSAGLLAAVSFALGGYLTGYPLLQLAILETMAWLPAALLAMQVAFVSRRPAPWLVAAGLALALAGLAGHPQTWMHVAYLSCAWLLAQSLAARWPWPRVLAAGGLVALVGLGVAAVGWLPALRYMLHTARSGVDYAFVSSGLPVADWVQVLVPTTMSLWAPQYAGLAPVALALLGWRLRRTPGALRWGILFWAGAALLSAWLALGDVGALYRVVYRLVPGLGLFRQQERWLGLWSLSLSVSGGLGLAAWLNAERAQRRSALAWATRWLGVGLASALALLALWRGLGEGWEIAWLRHALLGLVTLGLLTWERHRRVAACALVILLTADLYAVGLATVWRRPPDPAAWDKPAWLAEMESDELYRWDLTHLVYANWGEAYGLETVSGISPLRPGLLDEMRRLPQERFWQLLNVRYVVSTVWLPERPGLTQLRHVPQGSVPNQEAEGWLYRLEEPLPRAYMVHEAEIVADAGQAFQRLADPSWEPARSVVLLADEVPLAPPLAWPARPASVAVQRVSPRALLLVVESAAPGYLVISEWHMPGWRATLNGEPARLLTGNYALQALYLPAGTHTVQLAYAGTDVLWSGIASLMILAGAVAAALVWRPSVQPAPRKLWAWPAWLRLPDLNLSTVAERVLMGGLALAALGLRLDALGLGELGVDEAWAYLAAMRFPQGPAGLLRSWYPLALRGWMALFGAGELALRVPAALLGAALVVALWRLGRRLAGPWVGLGLATLAACAPGLVAVSQHADGRIPAALLFVVLATTTLLRATAREPAWRGAPAWLGWATYLAAISVALGAWAPAGWALLAHGGYLLAHCARQRRWTSAWAWAPVGAGGLGWAVVASGVDWSLVRQHLDAASASAAFRFLMDALAFWLGGPGWVPWATALLGVAGLLLSATWGRALWLRRDPNAVLLVGWLAAALVALFLASLGSEAFRREALVLAAPPWWCGVLLWGRKLWRRGNGPVRTVAVAILAALLALSLAGLQRYHRQRAEEGGLGYAALANVLRGEAQPGDPFIVVEEDPRWFYYLREAAPQPSTLPAHEALWDQSLAQLLAEHNVLWAAVPRQPASEAEVRLAGWLARETLPVREVRGARHILAAHMPPERATGVLPVADLIYADGAVALSAAHLLVNGRAVSAEHGPILLPRGGRVDLSLVWQAAGPTERNLTVFVHLLDERGLLVAQHDGPPAGGQRPTTTWAPGERILDRHTFSVPPSGAGQGRILVGLYDSETVVRALAQDGRDAIALYEVLLSGE